MVKEINEKQFQCETKSIVTEAYRYNLGLSGNISLLCNCDKYIPNFKR